jgi:class 3 adenylate cyclase/DNA-binding winged helix-turn-helix (wHTH) protein/tetratricopeptide (TPR) repeat protein
MSYAALCYPMTGNSRYERGTAMSSPQWIFDRFRLDPDHACLWCAEQALALTPKAFDVLHYLVTHPDRLVTKDELLDAVWPQTAVSDGVVRMAIGALRKALGDTAQTPRFIATVPRRGYRFLAPVTEYDGAVPGPAEPVPPAASPRPPYMPETPPRPGVALFPCALPPPGAERRYLTVLCCALMDATTLAGHLGPEDFLEVVRAYHQTCAAVIARFDGYLAQYLSDGVLAYFGYPMAHEDDAQRAVWTGLGILDALDSLNTRLTLPPGERVAAQLGVHTGLVVVGDVGEGPRHESLALGETPTIAAQLPSLAAPNTLVISATTYHLITGYFTCETLGEQTRRDLAQPLPVYRVLRPSGVQSRFEDAIARGLTPLVGREAEVGLLVERWARVKTGMGQVVVLEGEAGIGKSRLVQVLKDHVAGDAHTCLECRGSPYHQRTAWYPVTELLQRWLQRRSDETPGATLGKLEALLAQTPLALDEAVPLVAGLLALPVPAERYPPRVLTPEQQRQQTLDVLLALVGALAEQQPVLMIVEDLHWVDASTVELLELLIDQVPTTRIYTMLTCRPEFQPPWGFRTYLTLLALNRLTPPQVEEMVGEMLGGSRLPAAMLEQIVVKTDGIPLFVEELVKAVLEMGLDTAVLGQGVATGLFLAMAIPATLHEALLARLDRLGSAKGVAQLGAMLGHQFSYLLLRAIAPLEDEPLQRDLATLVAAELLYQRGRPPRAIYTFKHILVQEAAYESVLTRVRRQTHQRIVQVLEEQFPEMVATAPELLAHHALRGERWDKAVAYFRRAGEQAVARSAYREAVAAFEQALGAMPHLPESRDTLAQAIDLRLALRNALWSLGELERLFVSLQEAEVLAEALGDPHRLGWVAAALAGHFGQICELDQALASGQRALAIAADLGEVGLTVTAQHYLGFAYRSLGNYHQAIECFRKNVACLHGALLQKRFGLPGLSSVLSCGFLAASLAECGAFAEGKTLAEAGIRMAEAADHPYSRVIAYWTVGFRALCQGDLPPAIPILERALALAQETHIQLFVPRVTSTLGAVCALAGRIADALPLLEQAVEQTVTMRFMAEHALRVVWLGEAYLRAGRLDEAYIQAQRALGFSQVHQERGYVAYALRLLGEIHARHDLPEDEQAEAHYRQALTLAEELGMRPLQAHCHLGLGMLYSQMERLEDARTALSTAIHMYHTMEMAFWLPQAEAALGQVSG